MTGACDGVADHAPLAPGQVSLCAGSSARTQFTYNHARDCGLCIAVRLRGPSTSLRSSANKRQRRTRRRSGPGVAGRDRRSRLAGTRSGRDRPSRTASDADPHVFRAIANGAPLRVAPAMSQSAHFRGRRCTRGLAVDRVALATRHRATAMSQSACFRGRHRPRLQMYPLIYL